MRMSRGCSRERGSGRTGQQNRGKLFPQHFGDLVLLLLLSLTPNLVVRRLREGKGTVCTEFPVLPPSL